MIKVMLIDDWYPTIERIASNSRNNITTQNK